MIKTLPLPDDVDALKALLTEQRALNETLTHKKSVLQEQLNLALARRYAASSEKITADQLRLFDEAETDTTDVTIDTTDNDVNDTITVNRHSRKIKTGRKALPNILPRIEVVHELNDANRISNHDGNRLSEIGEVTSKQLGIIPATIQVIRKKYACRCGQCIKTTPLPSLKVSPAQDYWHTSLYPNTRMPYRYINISKFYNALGWRYRERP